MSKPLLSPCPKSGKLCQHDCPIRSVCAQPPIAASTSKDSPYRIDPDRLYSTKEAARLLNIAPHTLENWRVLGKGPKFIPLGNGGRCLIRYPGQELIKFLCPRGSTSE
jgi:hypothetical protein